MPSIPDTSRDGNRRFHGKWDVHPPGGDMRTAALAADRDEAGSR